VKISVKAKPGSREEKVEETGPGEFVVSVKEPPVQGRANAAIVRVLREFFNASSVRILSGHTSRNKIIEVL
jgi:uncharacterized protein (TIGR00251 family)